MNRFFWHALLLLAAGCTPGEMLSGAGAERTSSWFEVPRTTKSRQEIIKISRELMVREGYNAAEFDADGRAETGWETNLSVHFREGFRTKLEVQISPAGPGAFNVQVRSTMEINDNVNDCMLASRAQWVAAGISDRQKPHIPDAAIKFHQLLKLRLIGMNP